MAVRREAWPLHLRLTAGRPSWAGVARIGRRVTAEDHESATLFGLALVGYLVLALLLVYVSQAIVGDAWSRVGNAYYMLFSRDPHLAAIGFVWNPLPSLAVLPLLPFSLIWPDLVGAGLAGNIVSALFMVPASNLNGMSFQVEPVSLTSRIISPPPNIGGIASRCSRLA